MQRHKTTACLSLRMPRRCTAAYQLRPLLVASGQVLALAAWLATRLGALLGAFGRYLVLCVCVRANTCVCAFPRIVILVVLPCAVCRPNRQQTKMPFLTPLA